MKNSELFKGNTAHEAVDELLAPSTPQTTQRALQAKLEIALLTIQMLLDSRSEMSNNIARHVLECLRGNPGRSGKGTK